MVFINESGILGQIIIAGTQNMTGDLQLTVYFIVAFCLALCLMFGIPIELAAVVILPLCITVAAYGYFWSMLIVIILYLAAVICKNTIFR